MRLALLAVVFVLLLDASALAHYTGVQHAEPLPPPPEESEGPPALLILLGIGLSLAAVAGLVWLQERSKRLKAEEPTP